MKYSLPVIFILTTLLTSCCLLCDIKGDGNMVTSERMLTGSFTRIRLESNAQVFIIADTMQQVVVFADDNIEERILT